MIAKRWLISTFLLSLLIFLVCTLPAALAVRALPALQVGGQPVSFGAVQGSVWDGQLTWRWRRLAGAVSWQLSWRGGTPGVAFQTLGSLPASGWIGGADALKVRDLDFSLPASVVREAQPGLQLDGTISARGLSFTFANKRVTDAAGRLAYTGGEAQWRNESPVTVPALHGMITSLAQGAEIVVKDGDDSAMAVGRVEANIGSLSVYRAWTLRLGLSQGGDAADVVFETSLPLWSE